ncbi:MAG: hypothetical protein ACD_9C00326G0002 [uncultured bacterium]|nr:MAG: hypothetical protein ACD_9C00326G0002 [uncultured bacterium]KKQ46406.1 MAG: hypothetical protein US63_C0002G0019 [Candidatus Moranbacteria bacterium GW2011_GWC2_37_8]KKQ62729.1 MAG: hypothetical protein US82_C0007G0019 [Parcubacteria group bacterium GW2011_GWC1_38_22]KKQ80176.1 MAG: hypothetical protein UT03_C0031G0004 [Candidatus Moranbacteria bacterium GW2011_GWD2_38_7]
MKDFFSTVKKFIEQKGFKEKLSGMGESKMKQVGRDLASGKINIDQAIDLFLEERDYKFLVGRHERAELEKMLK